MSKCARFRSVKCPPRIEEQSGSSEKDYEKPKVHTPSNQFNGGGGENIEENHGCEEEVPDQYGSDWDRLERI